MKGRPSVRVPGEQAAADSMGLPPKAVREALHAAFRRARELGLSLQEVEDALSPAPVKPRSPRRPAAPPRA